MADGRDDRVGFVPGSAFLSFLFALALLKGVRMPNRWAATHYLLTYRTGFMKRALWGDVLWRTLGALTAKYIVLAGVGLAVLAILLALTIAICRSVPSGPLRLPLLLVVVSSPAITFAAHLAGYLEQVIYVGVLLVILPRRRWTVQVAAAIAAAALLPLVHEAAICWAGGLSLLAIVAGPAARSRTIGSRLAAAAIVAVVWLGSTAAVVRWGMVSAERAEAIRAERTAFANIRPRQDAFQTLTIPLDASLAEMRRRWADTNTRVEFAYSLLVFLPSTVLLTGMALKGVGAASASTVERIAIVTLTIAAVGGPLTLHAVGWDQHRWNALAAFNAGLAAAIILRASEKLRTSASGWWLGAAMALCVWNVASDPILFDAYSPSHPPFQYQIQFLRDAIRGGDPNLWIPRPGN